MDNHTGGGYIDNNDGGLETRKFFLNCLCLLLGRLDIKRFESTVSEFGMNISRILVPQVPLIEAFLGKYVADIFLNKNVTHPFNHANECVIFIFLRNPMFFPLHGSGLALNFMIRNLE